jgi:hypothetical protein
MPCSSSVIDEIGNVFSIKGLYNLNCKESRNFSIQNLERPKNVVIGQQHLIIWNFNESAEKIVNITSNNSKNSFNLNQLSFENLFNSKYKSIMWTIIIISIILFIIILFII